MAERKLTRKQKKELDARARAKNAPASAAPSRQKATGWKIPLIFIAAMAIIAGGVWFYRKETAPPPLPIRAELLPLAAASHVNLDADAEGRRFKEELIAAGRGFSPKYAKEAKVELVALQAFDAGRTDVVITALGVLRDPERRDRLLLELADVCMADCPRLPWAVFAVRNLSDYPRAVNLTHRLNARYDQCVAEGWTPAPAPMPKPDNGQDGGSDGGSGSQDAAASTGDGAGQAADQATDQAAGSPAASDASEKAADEASADRDAAATAPEGGAR